MSKLLLIDGNSIMNRGYFALPKTFTSKDGLHTNAILGFLNIFFKVSEEEKPTHVVVAFDMHAPTFRHKMYAEYKGTRHSMDDELREQFPVMKELLTTMGITYVEMEGWEADDIIGTYSRRGEEEGMEVTILSGDRDLLQLATDTVLVRIPKTKAGKTTVENYYAADVVTEYGVTPIEFIEMKGLMGDSSDNIPGVRGIGPKTASNIIQKYHTIEAALEDIDNVKPDKARQNLSEEREMALFSRKLATIETNVPVEKKAMDTGISDEKMFNPEVRSFFSRLNFNTLLKRMEDRFSGNADQSSEGGASQEIKSGPEILVKDAGYDEVIKTIKASDETVIGFYPAKIDGVIYGGAVAVSNNVYIVQDSKIEKIRKDIPKDKVLSLISIKEYISDFGFDEKDNLFDAHVAAYLIDPLNSNYSYDYLAAKYLGRDLADEKELMGKAEITIFSFGEENYRKLLAFNAFAAAASYDLLVKGLNDREEMELYKNIEYPAIFVLHEMENNGIKTDEKTLTDYGNDIKSQIDTLSKEIIELAGEEFNINSTKQLGVILFEKLGLKGSKKTKSGYSTSVDVLSKIKGEHEIIPKILEYRQLTKLLSTYIEGLVTEIKPDGRIHSRFTQTVTATGRLSSTEPNLQNIPTRTERGREIRKAFVPEDGFVFVDADYSQIELRVMASLSGDESLISAFCESKDIHAITASQVFGVPLDQVTPELRRNAKAVNFGIIYGISSFGLGEDLGISRTEAKEYIDAYFENYHQIKEYLDTLVSTAKEKGYVKTLFGRIRPIPELNNTNFMTRQFGERVAMNSPIQGTAADIIKIAMINVNRELKERKLKSRLILQIHDELLIETDKSEVDEVKELLVRNMEQAASLSVPLYVDVHVGTSLYEAK